MDETLPISEFGFPGPLRNRLVAAIPSGQKTTTTGLYEEYLGEPPVVIGDDTLVVCQRFRLVQTL